MTDRSVLVRLRADVSQYIRSIGAAGAATGGFVRQLDAADSRMSNVVQTALALGPATVPIAASITPAVAGLTMQLGFAAAGAGSMLLAFNGVGDALKALNEYRLAPTAENLDKLHAAMAPLGPDGQAFVRTLQQLRPEVQALQNISRAGIMPGATEGLQELMELAPLAERYIGTISTTVGELLAEAGDNLNDARWREFYRFLDREAEPALTATGRAVGNVVEGLANMLMAADPLSDMWLDGMLSKARDFRQWTDQLGESEGFERFIDYVEENGPQAMDTLGAIANTLVALVRASAPVGAVALPILELLADGLTVIADSPAGPALIGAAAGLSAVSRAVALYNAANGSAMMSMLTKGKGEGARAAVGWRAAGVGIGIFAAALTDLDDKAGLANTTTGALLGTMIAPGWGTAAGTAIGAVLDFAAANDSAEEAVDALYDAIERGGRGDIRSAMREVRAELRETRADMDNFWSVRPEAGESIFEKIGSDANALMAWITGGEGSLKSALGTGRAELMRTSGAARLFGASIGYSGRQMESAAADAQDLARELAILEGFFDRRSAIRSYEQAIDDLRKELRNGAKEWDVSTAAGRKNEEALDAVGTAMTQVIDKIKSPDVRRSFLVDARRQLVQMREQFPAAAGAIETVMDKLDRRLTTFAKNRPTPKLDADDRALRRKLNAADSWLLRFDRKAPEAALRADERDLRKKIDAADSWLLSFDRKSPQAKLGADASTAWDVFYRVDAWQPKPKTVHIGVTGAGAVGIGSALGNFFPAARHYAWGDFSNAHAPVIGGRGGPLRVWAEPETRGESYIPHANDSRRPRARGILEETARLFGGTVSWGGGHRYAGVMAGGAGSSTMRVDLGALRVVGTLDTPWGPAQVAGIARAAAQDAIADDRDLDSTLRGR